MSRIELGCPGHLIVANKCRWRRHTQVGIFRVSTVGDYFPDRDGPRDTVGSGPQDFFETMVFRTTGLPDPGSEGCGCCEVTSYDNIASARYVTAGEAQAGHERLVAEFEQD